MKTLAKDNYSKNEDFTINGTLISILGKTCTGKIQLEYNKNGEWIFKTVPENFDLKNL
jgi:hypothetical protein